MSLKGIGRRALDLRSDQGGDNKDKRDLQVPVALGVGSHHQKLCEGCHVSRERRSHSLSKCHQLEIRDSSTEVARVVEFRILVDPHSPARRDVLRKRGR